MGLADVIQEAAQAAFEAIDDIPVTCTYTSKGTSTYNSSTGEYTSTDTDYESLKFLFGQYSAQELQDENILPTDARITIPQNNLTPTPKKQDYLTDADGDVWQVEGIAKDAARALWILQGRKVG